VTAVDLIALGGTISMEDGEHGAVPKRSGRELADRFRPRRIVDLACVGGSEVDFGMLAALTRAVQGSVDDGISAVVVTVGTDAIEELAMWLVLSASWPVAVVVTGSMVPGARVGSDGMANLADAFAVAESGFLAGVVVVFAGAVFAGSEVLKVSGTRRVAFAAPGAGPIGSMLGGVLVLYRAPPPFQVVGIGSLPLLPTPLVTVALGDRGELLQMAAKGHPAVVVAGNGAGNVPPGVAEVIGKLLDQGTLVIVCSRTSDATVAPIYGYVGGSAGLEARGAVLPTGLSAHRARVLVTLARTHTDDPMTIRTIVMNSCRPLDRGAAA
jgi:L-asparaginase